MQGADGACPSGMCVGWSRSSKLGDPEDLQLLVPIPCPSFNQLTIMQSLADWAAPGILTSVEGPGMEKRERGA
jgi:hypothetical protein